MSDSVWPHRWQPTRHSLPWDSPGKNTGVGCQFLLQWMKVKSESEVSQSCQTLSDPMDCNLPGSPAHGIFQARVLEWGVIAYSDCTSSTVYIGLFFFLDISNKPHKINWTEFFERFLVSILCLFFFSCFEWLPCAINKNSVQAGLYWFHYCCWSLGLEIPVGFSLYLQIDF